MSDWAKFTQNPANNAHLVVYEDLKQVKHRPSSYSSQVHILEFKYDYETHQPLFENISDDLTMCNLCPEPSGGNAQACRVFGSASIR